jgi:hypothetical protein
MGRAAPALTRALVAAGADVLSIDTVRGEGYRLACPSRPEVSQPDGRAAV